jgi:hypothetical protein
MEYAAGHVNQPAATRMPEREPTSAPQVVSDTVHSNPFDDESAHLEDDSPITCVSAKVVETLTTRLKAEATKPLIKAACQAALSYCRTHPEWRCDETCAKADFINRICSDAREIMGGDLSRDDKMELFRVVSSEILRELIIPEAKMSGSGQADPNQNATGVDGHRSSDHKDAAGLQVPARVKNLNRDLDASRRRAIEDIRDETRRAVDTILAAAYASQKIIQRQGSGTSGAGETETLRQLVMLMLARTTGAGTGAEMPNPPPAEEVTAAFAGLGIRDAADLTAMMEQARLAYARAVNNFAYAELQGSSLERDEAAKTLAQADHYFGVLSQWAQHCAYANASRALAAAGQGQPAQVNNAYNVFVVQPGAQVVINTGGQQQVAQLQSGKPKELVEPPPPVHITHPNDFLGGRAISLPKGWKRESFDTVLAGAINSALAQTPGMAQEVLAAPDVHYKYLLLWKNLGGMTVAVALTKMGVGYQPYEARPRRIDIRALVLGVWSGTQYQPSQEELHNTRLRLYGDRKGKEIQVIDA